MTGFVYFLKPVGIDGPIRIGFSATPKSRLKNYMAWSPIPLEIITTIPGTQQLELNIHSCLYDSHSHSEWFHYTEEVRRVLAGLEAGHPIEVVLDLTKRKGDVRHRVRPQRREESRFLARYNGRIFQARRRLFNETGVVHHPPNWVRSLMRDLYDRVPTQDEIARLDACFDNYSDHFVRGQMP